MDSTDFGGFVLAYPLFKADGIEWKGWHAYHRRLATNLKQLGVQDTTIQCIVRHKTVSTTQRFYTKAAPQVTQQATHTLEEKIA